MSDELTLLQSSTPERLYRFAEQWHASLDPHAAAAAIGAPGEARHLVQDRRVQLIFAALCGQTRETMQDARRAAISWLCHAMTADPAGLFEPNGMVRMNMADIPPHIRQLLSVEIKSDGSWKAKLADKADANAKLLQLCGDLPTAGATGPRVVFHGRSS